MRIQSNMFLILALNFVWGFCAAQPMQTAVDIGMKLGNGIVSVKASGTMSTTGQQQMSGLPVTFTLTNDSIFSMSVGGPFGITAARMYSQPDTFVIVNYLMRDAACGNPATADLSSLIPVKLTVTDLASVMQGRIPGNMDRFDAMVGRNDHDVLLSFNSDTLTEHVLVDTALNVMKQYQRKRKGGYMEMNVTFGDVRKIGDVFIPHGIDVEVDNKSQTLSVRLDEVLLNGLVEPLSVSIPPSFSRTVYR